MTYENFAYYYDSLMDPKFYDDYVAFINKKVNYSSVLELGCGTGEIALRLAKQDKKVYASDISIDMLEIARYKAMNEDLSISFSCVDMRDFSCDQPVDLILCLCDSLNYILELKDIQNVFHHVYQSLHKNGTFIFDVNSLYKTDVILNHYKEVEEDEEFSFSWEVTNQSSGDITHHIKIIDKINQDSVEEIHHQITYPISTYQELLKQAGFEKTTIYSDFGPYEDKGERVIFVVRKEETI